MNFISNKFKNLIEYKSGYTWSKEQENSKFVDGSVRVLTVTNIQEKLDLRSELYLTQVTEKDRERKAASKGWSIAVSSNGNRKRIGNAVFINDDTDYLFASFLTGFIPKDPDTILPKYFFYWLSSHPIQERITSVSEGTTGLGNLDIRFLRNMDLEYPKDLSEQKAIAGIISKVDEAIEAVESSIKAAERLKKSLMQNLLTGKLKPDGTWRSEDEFFVDEKFGKYPKDWAFSRFKEFAVLQRGKDLADNDVIAGPYPVVKSNGVQIYHHAYFIKPPGVVTGRSGTIGKAFYITEKFWAHNTALYVKDFKGNCEKYIYYLIQRMDFRQYYAGTTVPTLNRNDIHRLKIAIPMNYEEQESIVKVIDDADTAIIQKEGKKLSLQKLKKSLMQNLLTGKVRVDVEKINKILEEV
jgi:type I restriction enzyme S subunit